MTLRCSATNFPTLKVKLIPNHNFLNQKKHLVFLKNMIMILRCSAANFPNWQFTLPGNQLPLCQLPWWLSIIYYTYFIVTAFIMGICLSPFADCPDDRSSLLYGIWLVCYKVTSIELFSNVLSELGQLNQFGGPDLACVQSA